METNLSSSSHKSDDVSVHSDSIPNSGADPATSIDKSNAPTSLQRFGSLTENSKLVAELTEEKEALQLKVSQLTKEMGERKAESDAVKEEFERFKKSEGQLNDMRSDVKSKSEEIQTLKIHEADSKNRISQLENEINTKMTNISQLTKEVEERNEEIDRYEREFEDEKEIWKRESDTIKTEFNQYKMDSQGMKRNLEFELQLKSNEIENLQKSGSKLMSQLAEMKSVVESKTEDIENLKLLTIQRGKTTKSLESEVQFKSNEIEYLKKSEAELKNRISELEKQINSNLTTIDHIILKISHGVRQILEKVETTSNDLRSLHNKTPEMTIRATFTEISKLTYTRVCSQFTEFTGLNWRINLYKYDNDNLSFFVEAKKKNADKWSCSSIVDWQLISQKNVNIVHSKKAANVFTSSHAWGFANFITFKELLDEENGYVMDDSIIVSATVKTFPTAQ